jgi:hypothetical protein
MESVIVFLRNDVRGPPIPALMASVLTVFLNDSGQLARIELD